MVTPQISIATPTPAIAYTASQIESAMPVASCSSLDYVPLDQQYDGGYNMYDDWIRSSDDLGWESESRCKHYLIFF